MRINVTIDLSDEQIRDIANLIVDGYGQGKACDKVRELIAENSGVLYDLTWGIISSRWKGETK